MRTALVISIEKPDVTRSPTFSFNYGIPRTALLIASCIKEWGSSVGLAPQLLNVDAKILKRWKSSNKNKGVDTILKEVIIDALNKFEPDLICIVATYTNVANLAKRTAKLCKKTRPRALVITGGPHATYTATELLALPDSPFDAVIMGPGEEKLAHIIKHFDNHRFRFNYPGIATKHPDYDPDTFKNDIVIPEIDYSLLDRKDLTDEGAVVMAGRGCPNSCQFCLESSFWRNAQIPYYERAIEVRNEIESLSNIGIPVYGIGDSLINLHETRLSQFENFCRHALSGLHLHKHFFILTRLHLLNHKACQIFKAVGGKAIWVGIESASEEILASMGKGEIKYIIEKKLEVAKECGIKMGAFFMFGFPGETSKSAKKNLLLIENLFKKKLLDYVDPSIFMPYPGLSLFADKRKIIRHEPQWRDWNNWGRYNKLPVYSLENLSSEKIYKYWQEAMEIKREYDLRENEE